MVILLMMVNWGLEAKKWQERKEALEALQTLLTQNPKLVSSDGFHELIGDLKKVFCFLESLISTIQIL